MNVITILIILTTIGQLIVCHFSLWWIIALCCRIMFMARIIGATFKVKKLAIGEGVAWASMLLWHMIFSKRSTLVTYWIVPIIFIYCCHSYVYR